MQKDKKLRAVEASEPKLTDDELRQLNEAFGGVDHRAREAQTVKLMLDAARARVETANQHVHAVAFKIMAHKGLSPDEYSIDRKETGEVVLQKFSKEVKKCLNGAFTC